MVAGPLTAVTQLESRVGGAPGPPKSSGVHVSVNTTYTPAGRTVLPEIATVRATTSRSYSQRLSAALDLDSSVGKPAKKLRTSQQKCKHTAIVYICGYFEKEKRKSCLDIVCIALLQGVEPWIN
jgi:hypothetical protein